MKKIKINLKNISDKDSYNLIKKFNILLEDFDAGNYIGYNMIEYKDGKNTIDFIYELYKNDDLCRLYMYRYIDTNIDCEFEISEI